MTHYIAPIPMITLIWFQIKYLNASISRLPNEIESTKCTKQSNRIITRKKQIWLYMICGKESSTKYYAQIHSRVCSGERSFKCSNCNKSFEYHHLRFMSEYILFNEHIYTEAAFTSAYDNPCSNAKTNSSEICGKQFNLKRNLIVHMYIPHPCTYLGCDKKCSRKNKLFSHQSKEHGA